MYSTLAVAISVEKKKKFGGDWRLAIHKIMYDDNDELYWFTSNN